MGGGQTDPFLHRRRVRLLRFMVEKILFPFFLSEVLRKGPSASDVHENVSEPEPLCRVSFGEKKKKNGNFDNSVQSWSGPQTPHWGSRPCWRAPVLQPLIKR